MLGAVVAAKQREHSVEHWPHFVNLVGLIHSLVCLIDQVQEVQDVDEVVKLHDFPKTRGAQDKAVAGPMSVALILWLDHSLLYLKPQDEEMP